MKKYIFTFLICSILGGCSIITTDEQSNLKDSSKWKYVSSAGVNTVAFKEDGTLWGWGRNEFGALGLGVGAPFHIFTPIKLISATGWSTVVAGGGYTMAIKTNGELWAWGVNRWGALGIGKWDEEDNYCRMLPQRVGSDTDWIDISCDTHNIALKKNGTLWAWGRNYRGALGLGDDKDRLSPVQIGTDTDWAKAVAGSFYTLALKKNGTLWAWGDYIGEFSDENSANNSRWIPRQVGNSSDWVFIAAGDGHYMAIKKDGTLWGWGDNREGELGLGDKNKRNEPTQIGTDKDWVIVSAGSCYTVAIKTDGTMWSWGLNHVGQLGLGNKGNELGKSVPCQIGVDKDWRTVECAGSSTLAIKTDGTLWGWGYNFCRALGLGNKEKITKPTKVD